MPPLYDILDSIKTDRDGGRSVLFLRASEFWHRLGNILIELSPLKLLLSLLRDLRRLKHVSRRYGHFTGGAHHAGLLRRGQKLRSHGQELVDQLWLLFSVDVLFAEWLLPR